MVFTEISIIVVHVVSKLMDVFMPGTVERLDYVVDVMMTIMSIFGLVSMVRSMEVIMIPVVTMIFMVIPV